ncbi:MAG: peptide-methionine (R)-S-oxide reductase MsrB [Candidatus Moraniibacteriota bacterium]|nr:MAG: peptide-methionine (R)-S-oxide reductase MsrB [Candidatus Moranbacteria bacterium]
MISFSTKIFLFVSIGLIITALFWAWHWRERQSHSYPATSLFASDSEYQKTSLQSRLEPAVYEVIANKATERPFSSPLNNEKRPGTYVAADTGEPVFRSEQKFDSGTGWPSFWAPVQPEAIKLQDDWSLLGKRTEVLSTAGGHLGHVFDDGPAPTGKRYCINGLALRFIPDESK